MRYSNRFRNREIVLEKVEAFRTERNIQVKCESDKTKLFINYIFSQLEGPAMAIDLPLEFKDKVYELYGRVRGKIEKTGIMKSEILALALIVYTYDTYRHDYDWRGLLTYTDIKMAYTGEEDRKKINGVAALGKYARTLSEYLSDPEFMIKEKMERKRRRYERNLKDARNTDLF